VKGDFHGYVENGKHVADFPAARGVKRALHFFHDE
jgi:hypothetical protein